MSLFAGLPCRFSQEWRGRYFQSGLGEIIILDNVITTKGTCIEQDRDYYLFDNRCAVVSLSVNLTLHIWDGGGGFGYPVATDRLSDGADAPFATSDWSLQ